VRLLVVFLISYLSQGVSFAADGPVCTAPTPAASPGLQSILNVGSQLIDRMKLKRNPLAPSNPSASDQFSYTKMYQDISPIFGQCLLKQVDKYVWVNKKKKIKRHYTEIAPPKLNQSVNAFDQTVAKYWQGTELRNLDPSYAKLLTPEKLVAIDGLARTIYGEMAICYHPRTPKETIKRNCGKEYLMGVAANILARAKFHDANKDNTKPGEAWKRDRFAELEDLPIKNTISRVLSKGYQYSVWNHRGKDGVNPSLSQVLCPPQKSGQLFYTNAPASIREAEVWHESLMAAMDAVLQPEKWAPIVEKTPLYYTSRIGDYMAEKFNMERKVAPQIHGKKLDNDRCFDWWGYKGE
jgi:hypothetical protein